MKFSISVAMSPPEQYVPLATQAEQLGYHAMVLPDSIFYSETASSRYPYTADGERMWRAETPWVDPAVGAAVMAGATSRLFFYTSVLKLAVRNPLLVAKQVASLDAVSGGRFGLGAGIGWLKEEFEWCGADWKSRGKRMNEALEILRLVWTGEMVEYSGKYYQFGKLQMSPAPASGHIPIYLGGHSAPALRRAAKYGDGWSSAMLTMDQAIEIIDELKRLRKDQGRDHLPFEIQIALVDARKPDDFRRMADAGVTDFIMVPWLGFGGPMEGGPLQARVDGMQRFRDLVMAPLDAIVT